MEIEENIARVRQKVTAAAVSAGRDPASVRLIAVSKTIPVAKIAAAHDAGLRLFGENRVQEAVAKFTDPPFEDYELHLIGRLQSNKARTAVELFDTIHSADSLKLLHLLEKEAAARQKNLAVFLEVNVGGETTKSGLAPDTLISFVGAIGELHYVRLRGLMTVAPPVKEAAEARPIFRRLRELRDELAIRFPMHDWTELSMGMSDDFTAAVAEGATLIRIGRAIFGARG